MPITLHDRPVYKLVCDGCGHVAEWEGLPARFDSREEAASYAEDFGWDGPWCLNNGVPTFCPDCKAKRAEQAHREQSDRDHHQGEIAAAIRHATEELTR